MEDREKTMSQPQTGQDDSFWWTVEFSLGGKETGGVATEEDTPWNEERLWTVATMSGAIGSELVEKDGKLSMRAHYLGTEDLDELIKRLDNILTPFDGVTLSGCYKTQNQRWDTQSLDAFPPLNVGRSLVVMAPWHKGEDRSGRIPIYIYPASAFGTGYHESTRIALELLEDCLKRGDTVLDVGTGTGILFIAALKLGASHVIARDLDPTTIEEAKRNMNLNGINSRVCDLDVGDLLKGVDVQGNILTANILLSPNLAMLPDVKRVLKPKGYAIFSGMTSMEKGIFLSMLSSSGLNVERELRFGDWWGCCARKAWGR
ncbi:MAG: 50S ribosomal protein L11 methyltransferase [Synergistaceae bacterium]|nr:50S ribosomal protein L11 methyltransferase [Synergistaceae bacterium]